MDVPQNRTHFLAEFPPDIHILREMSMCKKLPFGIFLKAIPVPTGTHLTSWLIGFLWFPYFGLS